jgi:hypothetical protein
MSYDPPDTPAEAAAHNRIFPGWSFDQKPCTVVGCERTTGIQGDDEALYGVMLCDPSGMTAEQGNHYLQLIDAIDAGEGQRWVIETHTRSY